MNEKEAMAFIEETAGYGIVPGLDSIRELCRRLGSPQKDLKFVHIAGTNGKGSVGLYFFRPESGRIQGGTIYFTGYFFLSGENSGQ